MGEISVDELYEYFYSSLSHCGTFLLKCNDSDIDYHVFEEFDGDCVSFFSDLSLQALLSADRISEDVYIKALNLAKLFRSMENTKLWNADAVRTSEEWFRILTLADELKRSLANKD